ncbi:hypothetical protein Q3G72_014234 [Acer saccharum]|nr:hypothetical protein Q3G72_014234 [Acer saccharum]
MFDFSSVKEPYQAVMDGRWEDLEEIFGNDEGFSISYPIMTVAEDNAFHIAVHSKSEQPLKQLLEQLNNDHMRKEALHTFNAYENTVIQEAAINHNIAAVKLLVGEGHVTDEQLLERNKSGQTLLFKAAAFGSTKVVKSSLSDKPSTDVSSPSTAVSKQVIDNEPAGHTIVKEPSRTDIEMGSEIPIEEAVETPLLASTRRGVIELVKEILKMHPRAVEHNGIAKEVKKIVTILNEADVPSEDVVDDELAQSFHCPYTQQDQYMAVYEDVYLCLADHPL